MADSFELPDETERLQINLEDDVRAFLLSRLPGRQMEPEKKEELQELGVDIRRLSKPSYISIKSGCDGDDDEDTEPRGCAVGAEGVMVHEDEHTVHLAFKCGDEDHDIHYTQFMPLSIIEMAKGLEAVWPGSVMVPLLQQAVELGRAETTTELDDEGVTRLLEALRNLDVPNEEEEESEEDGFDLFPDFEDDSPPP